MDLFRNIIIPSVCKSITGSKLYQKIDINVIQPVNNTVVQPVQNVITNVISSNETIQTTKYKVVKSLNTAKTSIDESLKSVDKFSAKYFGEYYQIVPFFKKYKELDNKYCSNQLFDQDDAFLRDFKEFVQFNLRSVRDDYDTDFMLSYTLNAYLCILYEKCCKEIYNIVSNEIDNLLANILMYINSRNEIRKRLFRSVLRNIEAITLNNCKKLIHMKIILNFIGHLIAYKYFTEDGIKNKNTIQFDIFDEKLHRKIVDKLLPENIPSGIISMIDELNISIKSNDAKSNKPNDAKSNKSDDEESSESVDDDELFDSDNSDDEDSIESGKKKLNNALLNALIFGNTPSTLFSDGEELNNSDDDVDTSKVNGNKAINNNCRRVVF